MITVVVTDRRKVCVQDKATAAPVDSKSDEHFYEKIGENIDNYIHHYVDIHLI